MAPVDWSSLPSDLVGRVADVFLATSDVDYYMSLRAVCHNWRASTDDAMGLRFHLLRWVMLDADDDLGRCLLLNVDTGRFLWKDLPMLRNYDGVAPATNGRLVLLAATATGGSKVCILNPFTGHQASFLLDRWCSTIFYGGKAVVAGSSSQALYTVWRDAQPVARIDPASGRRRRRRAATFTVFNPPILLEHITTVATFQGRVYAVDRQGTVFLEDLQENGSEMMTIVVVVAGNVGEECGCPFLVSNAGELLMVRLPTSRSGMQVLMVDVENKVLEAVGQIGSRAIFLAFGRCLSVDATNLPGIGGNCVYYYDRYERDGGIRGLHLDGREELLETAVHGRRPLGLLEYIMTRCTQLFTSTKIRSA